jgi:rod shape-determining protein MreD
VTPVTGQLVARLAVLGLVVVVLQSAVVSQIEILGVAADITPLVVVSAGLLLGSVPGAGFGFAVGLLVDTALLQTLGVSSLLLVAIGYGAGRLRELRDPAHGLVPMAVGAAAAAVSAFGFAVLQFLLGVDVPLSLLLLRDLLIAIVLGTLLALPVYQVTRRALLPFLPDDPRRRRRRAYTTGGLSPLSRARRA